MIDPSSVLRVEGKRKQELKQIQGPGLWTWYHPRLYKFPIAAVTNATNPVRSKWKCQLFYVPLGGSKRSHFSAFSSFHGVPVCDLWPLYPSFRPAVCFPNTNHFLFSWRTLWSLGLTCIIQNIPDNPPSQDSECSNTPKSLLPNKATYLQISWIRMGTSLRGRYSIYHKSIFALNFSLPLAKDLA
jgi:hypothetical protein